MLDGEKIGKTNLYECRENFTDKLQEAVLQNVKKSSVPETEWVGDNGYLGDSISPFMDEALRMSPGNTATSYDGMSYPFIRFWHRKANASFVWCLKQAVHHGNRDWHQGKVVLIRKADKLCYDVVKAWRMIHLLPVMAKVVERMVLVAVAKHVDLEDTQFGSWRKRGVHDALAVVYEFLKTHKNWHKALLSLGVEGGFDPLDIDMLADLLVARGCPSEYVSWIRHWSSQRRVRFNLNGCISSEYFLSKGIPQGSPLSAFLFGLYVADIFRPRLPYSPSLRSITVSYVDDAGIVVAADSQEMVRGELERVFDECPVVAKGGLLMRYRGRVGWVRFRFLLLMICVFWV